MNAWNTGNMSCVICPSGFWTRFPHSARTNCSTIRETGLYFYWLMDYIFTFYEGCASVWFERIPRNEEFFRFFATTFCSSLHWRHAGIQKRRMSSDEVCWRFLKQVVKHMQFIGQRTVYIALWLCWTLLIFEKAIKIGVNVSKIIGIRIIWKHGR